MFTVLTSKLTRSAKYVTLSLSFVMLFELTSRDFSGSYSHHLLCLSEFRKSTFNSFISLSVSSWIVHTRSGTTNQIVFWVNSNIWTEPHNDATLVRILFFLIHLRISILFSPGITYTLAINFHVFYTGSRFWPYMKTCRIMNFFLCPAGLYLCDIFFNIIF